MARTPASALAGAAGVALGVVLTVVVGRAIRNRRRREQKRKWAPKRFGSAIKLRPGSYDRYTQLHDRVWTEILERMYRSNIRNFTIYYHKETRTLFQHFEWIGNQDCDDTEEETERRFKADMDAISSDPIVQEWWGHCEPCQEPFSQWPAGERPPSQQGGMSGTNRGDWWAPLQCLCHCGHWPVSYSEEMRDPEFKPKNPHGLTSTRQNPPPVSIYPAKTVDQ